MNQTQATLSPSDAIVTLILDTVPEFLPVFDSLALVHAHSMSLGTFFAELAAFVGESAVREPFPYELVGRCLDVVEELLAAGGEDVHAEIGASFLGNLPITAITASLLWMGPETLTALEELDTDFDSKGLADPETA